MADKIFVIYATNMGTSTARPVLEYYTEDEAHTPDVALLGYSASTSAWTSVSSLDVLAPASGDEKNKLTINPTTQAIASTTISRFDLAARQTSVLQKTADLIAEWNWTQELDAKITKSCQQAFAAWIEQLEAIPSNALWGTNPTGITIPAPPPLETSSDTVAQQVAQASWTDDAAMPSQKLNVSNPVTLQPVWGFDTDDLSVFGKHARITLGWTAGRSGHRSLLATASAGTVQTVWVTPGVPYSFAMAPGDTFYIEAWVRGTTDSTVNVGLTGFSSRTGQATSYNGGDGQATVTASPTIWRRVSGYVQVPSGNPIRWGSVEFTFQAGASTAWIEIDNITATRVPRLPNVYAQATDTVAVSYTGADATQADTALLLGFFRGGNGATVKLNTTCRIVPQSASGDQMRMQFWLTRKVLPSGAEGVITTWLEYGNGAALHHNTAMEWTDPIADNNRVEYRLRVSKLGSVGAMSIAHRSLSAVLLPKL